jgi:ABC-type Fe3+/spermidine/putrescine transport system ATPase subunit
MSSVTLDGMSKSYGGAPAVDAVNLVIPEGEFLVLLGPSGCGKTTTLRCIAGLEDVTGGRILMDGAVVSSTGGTVPPEKRGMGMVFQSYAVWPHMTVAENVAFGLKLKAMSRADVTARVGRALDLVNLAQLGDRGIHQLSGGQQQRVALARAVALEPSVLLFDEPLSNLDAQLREHMRFELRQLQQRLGITAVYVTHDQQEAMVVADRIALMNRGRIEQAGTPAAIYRQPASLFAAGFVGLTNALPGIVLGTGENGQVHVRIADGFELLSHMGSLASGLTPGAAAHALVRPEHVSVAGPDGPGVPATVEASVFLGNITDLVLCAGGVSVRAQLSPAVDWPVGGAVRITIPPASVSLLPVG